MKFCIALVCLLFLCGFGYSQDGMVYTWSGSVTLDSSDTESLWLGLFSRDGGGTRGFSSSAITPRNAVRFNDHLVITGYIDSLKASTAKDSISGKMEFLDKDGYVLGSEVIWFDFANNDSVATETQIAAFTPWNRATPTLGVSNPTFWVDFTGMMKACHGLKFTFTHTGVGGSNDSLKVTINVAQGLNTNSFFR